jgi:hypothetical protein
MTVVIKVKKNSLELNCSTKDYETIRSFLLAWADEQAYKLNEVLTSEEVAESVKRCGRTVTSIGSDNFPPRLSNEYNLYMRDLGYNPTEQAAFLYNSLKLEFPALKIVVN